MYCEFYTHLKYILRSYTRKEMDSGLRTQTGLGDTYEHCECEQTAQLPASAALPAKMGQQWFSTHRMGVRMGTWCALKLWAGGSAQLKLLQMKENRDFFFLSIHELHICGHPLANTCTRMEL